MVPYYDSSRIYCTPRPILASKAPILCIQGSSNHKASDNGSQNYETELLAKQNHDSSAFTAPLADLQVAISVLCLYYATYVLNMFQLYQFTYELVEWVCGAHMTCLGGLA